MGELSKIYRFVAVYSVFIASQQGHILLMTISLCDYFLPVASCGIVTAYHVSCNVSGVNPLMLAPIQGADMSGQNDMFLMANCILYFPLDITKAKQWMVLCLAS